MRDSKLFDEGMKTYFLPFAQKHGLSWAKERDGVYDILSPYYILRIRLDTGHRRGANVILRPASHRVFDENDPTVQIGLRWFAEFYGKKSQNLFNEVSDRESFLDQMRLLALAAEQYAEPYLLGRGRNWDAIKEQIRAGAHQESEAIKQYRFPKNVRKEWL